MIGTWDTQSEATIYGFLEVDVTKANAYIEKLREKTGLRVSITHVVLMVFALTLSLSLFYFSSLFTLSFSTSTGPWTFNESCSCY